MFSAGLPSWLVAGRISPRDPRLVFSVAAQICVTYPNSFGLPSLRLRIGLASGSKIDTSLSVIRSPATRFWICSTTRSARSMNRSSRSIWRSFARAPRPRARRRATTSSRLASPSERATSLPACSVSSSSCALRSPVRRPSVRVIARTRRPTARDRSRTQPASRPTFAARLRAARASTLALSSASPESVGQRTSDSTTVESILTARARKRGSGCALAITSRVSSSTTSGPSRRVSFLSVDSSGTRSPTAIRQKRRSCSESETSRSSVSYPQPLRCLTTIRRI